MIKNHLDRHGIMLMYHRVAELEADPWQLAVTREHFEGQMLVIKKYARTVQMRRMAEAAGSWNFGPKRIVITFDDGYADNFYNARPVLERHDIQATFFIVSGMVGRDEEFWWDELERIILGAGRLPGEFRMTISGKEYHWPLKPSFLNELLKYENSILAIPGNGTEIVFGQLYYVLWKIFCSIPFEERKAVLGKIAAWAGQPAMAARDSHKIMSTKQLQALSSVPLFEMGAHTCSHPMLSQLSKERQQQEIQGSKEMLEEMLGLEIDSFSYPHGMYAMETVDLVRDSGFKASCTVIEKPVTRKDDPFLLPRYTVRNWDAETFEKKLKEWLN